MENTNEMQVTFDSRSSNEAFARVTVAAFMTSLNPTVEEVSDVKTAVSEAVTNAIIHGYENEIHKITIRCRTEGKTLYLEVEDYGRGIEDVQQAMEPLFTTKPDLDRSGMGFSFMEAFMDRLEVVSTPGEQIKKIPLMTFQNTDQKQESRAAISVLGVIKKIHGEIPDLEIQNVGEIDFIITYKKEKDAGKLMHLLKIVFVVLISFFGAAFSAMAFNNDVDTVTMFGQIYQLVTGRTSDGFTILEITYSIGLIVGILIFFNHFGKSKVSVDPTPLEVEMRLYENDIQTTLIENYSRNSGNKEDSSNGKGSKG